MDQPKTISAFSKGKKTGSEQQQEIVQLAQQGSVNKLLTPVVMATSRVSELRNQKKRKFVHERK